MNDTKHTTDPAATSSDSILNPTAQCAFALAGCETETSPTAPAAPAARATSSQRVELAPPVAAAIANSQLPPGRPIPVTVTGSALTDLLRAAFEREDWQAMRAMCPGWPWSGLRAVGASKAHVTGDSKMGFRVEVSSALDLTPKDFEQADPHAPDMTPGGAIWCPGLGKLVKDCGHPCLGVVCRRVKPAQAQLTEARDLLAEATGGRPDFEGFADALDGEADWTKSLYRSGPAVDQAQASSDAAALRRLAETVRRWA